MNKLFDYNKSMKKFRGIAASSGIAIGNAWVIDQDFAAVPCYSVAPHMLSAEKKRLTSAVQSAIGEIQDIKKQSHTILNEGLQAVLESQILMLRDKTFLASVHKELAVHNKNVEWVFVQTIQPFLEKLSQSSDEYLRERTSDIRDISRRVLKHLYNVKAPNTASFKKETIIVAHDIMPSEAMSIDRHTVAAIATDIGGKTSHTAIIAESFGLPAVLGLSHISHNVVTGEKIIVDGNNGVVIVNPSSAVLMHYTQLQRTWKRHSVELESLHALPAKTKDEKEVKLYGNIETAHEAKEVLKHGGAGIGLYRSEFLFLEPDHILSEDEQYEAYSKVIKVFSDGPVTIRTLDVGGDKAFSHLPMGYEKNPMLGWRSIRFCLSEVRIFRTQLRALLRASVHGNLRILFPMISGLSEFNEAMEHLSVVKDELLKEGIPFNTDIKVGSMIEIPSAAITSDVIAEKADFFSIGTNDLIQYTIAVDRGNEHVAYLYDSLNLGVLRLIDMTIKNGHKAGIPVAMCGEMAGNILAICILLGLGLDEFSVSCGAISKVKYHIRNTTYAAAQEFAYEVMEITNRKKRHTFVKKYMKENFNLY